MLPPRRLPFCVSSFCARARAIAGRGFCGCIRQASSCVAGLARKSRLRTSALNFLSKPLGNTIGAPPMPVVPLTTPKPRSAARPHAHALVCKGACRPPAPHAFRRCRTATSAAGRRSATLAACWRGQSCPRPASGPEGCCLSWNRRMGCFLEFNS